jgi:superfamily II DNA or RNA helicase
MAIKIKLPHLFAVNTDIGGNLIQQINQPGHSIEAEIANYTSPNISGKIIIPSGGEEKILLVQKKIHATDSFAKLIFVTQKHLDAKNGVLDLSINFWLKHPHLKEGSVNYNDLISSVLTSWENGFSFIRQDDDRSVKGLREPQVGAYHAINAHWATTSDPATIVMPTGTGKTETMIAVFVSSCSERLMVVVPTDALRTQLAAKFLTFGVLRDFGAISSSCLHPVVGILKHKPTTTGEVDDFFEKCNVIVTTSQIAGQVDEELQERMAHHCSSLFIDEAHHVSAQTWKAFKEKFAARRILQFTATPYREDDKPVEGKIIFKYPLSRAQEKKYFTKINFKPVKVFARRKRDQAIAAQAVRQLREDLKKYNHILMARVNTIERAKEVFAVYKQYEEFDPVQIHTGIKSKKTRDEIKQKLLSGKSKIVVCVDMLGEGFDLPELKIAAFHDIKKSPAVTIQLAGRFTRARHDLGDATFIANVGDEEVRSELKKLYTREPDWNFLLPQLSEELIQEQLDLNEFAEGFGNFPKDIPIQSLCPALSTVIYKTKCEEWTPDNYLKGLLGADSFEKKFHDINVESRTLIIITVRKVPVEWTKVEEVFNWDWNLYVVFWDKEQNLLFINNSSNSGDFKKLAQAVAGDDVEMIKGEPLFRCFGNITRITFKNIGLSEHLGRMVSYTGRMGADVEPVLTEIQKQRASKSVLMGTGFENGQKTSIGCSAKGRIWAHARSFHLNKLIEWCSVIGRKVLDENIDSNGFLRNTLVSQFVSERPLKMPFGINWSEDVYKSSESAITFKFGEVVERQLYEVDINLVEPSESGDLRFEVASEGISSQFTLTLYSKNDVPDFAIKNTSETKLTVEWGASRSSGEEFFYDSPPAIWFIDGSQLCGDKYTSPIKRLEPYARENITAWDWSGVDIRVESQRVEKRANSVQYRVIRELKKGDFDVVFDDDSSGEVADVVAIKVDDGARIIKVELYHCKFSGEDSPGARVGDLYEVCGQSQKSIRWMENPRELFLHLLRREEKRQDEDNATRIEVGDWDKIEEIAEKSIVYRTQAKIFMVQPGLSKKKVSPEQLELLSVTESYLKETYLIPFNVIASE